MIVSGSVAVVVLRAVALTLLHCSLFRAKRRSVPRAILGIDQSRLEAIIAIRLRRLHVAAESLSAEEVVRQLQGDDMKLHEIGLFAKDPQASKKFYHDILGLRLDHEEEDGLSVLAEELRAEGIKFAGPADIHLGKRGIMLMDPDGLRVSAGLAQEDGAIVR
jgi:predicted enzyme related to lactoylglutathione lyase